MCNSKVLLPQEFAAQKHRRKPESLELKTFGRTLNFYFFRRCCFTVFLLYHFLQESAIILIFVPLCNLSLFSGCFEDFSLSLVLSSFILMCLCVRIFLVLVGFIELFSWICGFMCSSDLGKSWALFFIVFSILSPCAVLRGLQSHAC